jgi:hypothetical protein
MFYNFSESEVLNHGDRCITARNCRHVPLIYEAIHTSQHVTKTTEKRNAYSDFGWKPKREKRIWKILA